MAHAFYHEYPETLKIETDVVDARPGRVLLAQSPFFPGGGGQLPDRGVIRWNGGEAAVTGFETVDGAVWHLIDGSGEVAGRVEAEVEPTFRQMMRELHTATHILNAFVFQAFSGALVTGAQLNADGTARMDFDLPDANTDRLKAIDVPINVAIQENLELRFGYVPIEEAQGAHGLIRTQSVAPPPTTDGQIRIVEIVGLDRQACGGTHLASTGASRQVKVLKIDNKGRHNRRVRIGLV
jgi:misacylated tRNA(Ala) deacylase